ncbi:helix-turn-helix transcriptional regulator [Streptomyces laculatispora]|uniref:Helix-turn-helix transcriptional regulator n=1 Tax=Streptomyces laculatispora TaxID=887464 RepID=A0ABY9HXL7_9ACTN|nr:helix-turn-helix transcriptional regulator [Streptomyces laculatispora]WLQ39322.1 helix-turn-helix transcriptional regulator [Streptomyces laculatispora]
MPPRSIPTARQQCLGHEPRKLREQSGMTAQRAAALLGVDRTRIPNIESGRFPGLLQTEEHARAAFDTADPQLPRPI